MAKQTINLGTIANDGTGDTLRNAFGKASNNFNELYFNVSNVTSNLSNLITVVDTTDGELYTLSAAGFDVANAAYDYANLVLTSAQAATQIANTVNSAWALSNAAFNFANGTVVRTNAIYTLTNSAYNTANAAYAFANSLPMASAIANASGAFDQANLAYIRSDLAWSQANVATALVLGACTNVASAYSFANGVSANTTSAYRVANSNYNVTNVAYGAANAVFFKTNSAYTVVNAAFDTANSKINTVDGVSTGTFTAQGNVYVYGTSTLASGLHSFDSSGGTLQKTLKIKANPSNGYATLGFYSSDGLSLINNLSANGSGLTFSAGFTSYGSIITSSDIRAYGDITAYFTSDERFKENVISIPNALEKVNLLNGVEFDWTEEYIKGHGGVDGYFVRKHDVGVLAQQLEKVLPEAVITRPDGTKAVRYERVVPLLISAINDLTDKVNKLEGK